MIEYNLFFSEALTQGISFDRVFETVGRWVQAPKSLSVGGRMESTLIAGHRSQKEGPVSEAIIARTDSDTGKVEVELTTFDEQHRERPGMANDGVIAKSFIILPAGLMDALAKEWAAKYPSSLEEEGWTPLMGPDNESNLTAAGYVRSQS